MPESQSLNRLPTAGEGEPERRPDDDAGRPRLLRVACPQGHKLDAPCVLDGQDVVCPYCGERFLFSYERSEEYAHESDPPAARDCRSRSPWLDWLALTATIAVVGALVLQWLARGQ